MLIKLKQHQKKVVTYMKKTNKRGLILYHGLGSGKTITAIAITELYKNKVLVIVPASMRVQWKAELKKMNVNLQKYNIVSYEEFVNLLKKNKSYSLKNTNVIVDEAHRIRNTSGIVANKIIKFLQKCNKVLLLTGTPMVNAPVDMSALVNSISGSNILPVNEKSFRDKFFVLQSRKPPPLEKRCKEYSSITCSNDGLRVKKDYCKYHYYMSMRRSSKKIRDLNNFKRNISYELKEKERILKARAKANHFKLVPNLSEYGKYVHNMVSYYKPELTADFPKVTEKIIKVSMSTTQNKIYQKLSKRITKADLSLLQTGHEITKKTSAFNAFLNLTRQISNTWKGSTDSPKLQQIIKYIKKGPKPCIVYSNWLQNGIEPIAKLLEKSKISYLEFTGSMNDTKKNNAVTNYNKGQIDVLLLSSSGGEGLDLKNTRQIHIMEPHWNIAKINQVIGRGVRYKSHISLPKNKQNVTVYYWISTPLNQKGKMGTDEYLYTLSENKKEEMELFLTTVKKKSIEKSM